MEALLVLVTQWWWVAPAAAGAGTAAVMAVNRRGPSRRIAYDAARHELQRAKVDATKARADVRVARAEEQRTIAERELGRAGGADVAAARRRVGEAEREARAAASEISVRRAQLRAARASLPAASSKDPADHPLAQLMARHERINAAWLEYETDAAKVLGFPAMSDPRVPTTAAFLEAQQRAQWLRPESNRARLSPEAFGAYRNAVDAQQRAFERAERAARGGAGAGGEGGGERFGGRTLPEWAALASDTLSRSASLVGKAGEHAARAAELFRKPPKA